MVILCKCADIHPPWPPQKGKGERLGWVRIPVMEVVVNGMIKDSFTLRDAERGTVELKLEWMEIDFEG